MDNNSGNSGQNQPPPDQENPQPIMETIEDPNIQAEEIPSSVSNPDEALFSVPLDVPPDQSFYTSSGSNRNKYIIIAGVVVFFIVILVIILRIFLGGNSGSSGGSAATEPVTLDYWILWENKSVYEEIIAEYQKNNPNVTINMVEVPKEEYLDKLLARSKNGVGPDIFRFHNTWLPILSEVVTPLPSQVMSNEEFEKTFYPVHARDLKIDNYYYGVPLMIDGLVLVYNDTLLRNAGETSPPSSPDQLAVVAGKLTTRNPDGTTDIAGLALGSATNVSHFSDFYGLWLLQNFGLTDPKLAEKSRNEIWKYLLEMDSQEGQSIFEIYRSFAENNTWSDSMPNSISAFIQQKVAMIIVPSWQILVIKEQNPDINLKVAPVPQFIQRNIAPVALASYWVEGVSKYSKNQNEAWKFVKYLSEKETMEKMYAKQTQERIFGEPYSRVDLADTIADDPYIGPVIKQAQYYYSLPVNARTFDGVRGEDNIGGLNDAIIKYLENAVNTRAQGGSSAEALKTAKQGVVQVFEKYGIQ